MYEYEQCIRRCESVIASCRVETGAQREVRLGAPGRSHAVPGAATCTESI